MEALNGFAKNHLYLDLLDPSRVLKPWSSLRTILHHICLASFAIRFGLFTFGIRSKDAIFYLGILPYEFYGGVEFWAPDTALLAATTLCSLYVTYQESKHANYSTTLHNAMMSVLNRQTSTIRRLVQGGTVCVISASLYVIMLESLPNILISIDDEKTTYWFLYCLQSTYQSCMLAVSASSAVVTFGLFLHVTCKLLRKKLHQTSRRLTKQLKEISQPPPLTLLLQFNSACATVKMFDRFWKKVLFINVYGYALILGCSAFLVIFTDLMLPIKVVAIVVVIQFFCIVSAMLLVAATVNGSARKLYGRFCALAARTQKQKQKPKWKGIKLAYMIKRFSNPISLTLWDSNYLEYFDYYQFVVGVTSNFILIANLMSKE